MGEYNPMRRLGLSAVGLVGMLNVLPGLANEEMCQNIEELRPVADSIGEKYEVHLLLMKNSDSCEFSSCLDKTGDGACDLIDPQSEEYARFFGAYEEFMQYRMSNGL